MLIFPFCNADTFCWKKPRLGMGAPRGPQHLPGPRLAAHRPSLGPPGSGAPQSWQEPQPGEKPCPLHPECLQSSSNHTMEIPLKLLIAHFLPPTIFF